MVHTTVRPVSTVFRTVLITIAAALASSPDVGSSMKIIEGLLPVQLLLSISFFVLWTDHLLQGTPPEHHLVYSTLQDP